MNKFPVIEDFISIQGEGPLAGHLAYFLRVKRCNFKEGCIVGCDTMEKMLFNREYKVSFQDILKKFKDIKHIVITGGEPTLYNKYIQDLISYLASNQDCENKIVEIETNGFRIVKLLDYLKREGILVDIFYKIRINLSPKEYETNKLFNLYSKLIRYINSQDICIKIVTWENKYVLEFIKSLVHYPDMQHCIWLMPWGRTLEEIRSSFPLTLELAKKYNFKVSPRMQIAFNCL